MYEEPIRAEESVLMRCGLSVNHFDQRTEEWAQREPLGVPEEPPGADIIMCVAVWSLGSSCQTDHGESVLT